MHSAELLPVFCRNLLDDSFSVPCLYAGPATFADALGLMTTPLRGAGLAAFLYHHRSTGFMQNIQGCYLVYAAGIAGGMVGVVGAEMDAILDSLTSKGDVRSSNFLYGSCRQQSLCQDASAWCTSCAPGCEFCCQAGACGYKVLHVKWILDRALTIASCSGADFAVLAFS